MLLASQTRFISKIALALAALSMTGCAGSITSWIVDTRVHQGDVALERGNPKDAELAYRLALKVDPNNEPARAGMIESSYALAQVLYSKGDFEGALTTIAEGMKVDPTSVRLSALKSAIEDAKLKREIVISNYPTYKTAGAALTASYEALNASNKSILSALKAFSYTYNTDELTLAIKRSYDLEIEVARNTNRMITYRQVVTSGIPGAAQTTTTSVSGASLLPLP